MYKLLKISVFVYFAINMLMGMGLFAQEEQSGAEIREQKYKEAMQYKTQKQQFVEGNPDSRYYNYRGGERSSSNTAPRIQKQEYNTEYGQYTPAYNKGASPEVVEYDLRSIESRLTTKNDQTYNPTAGVKTQPTGISRIISETGLETPKTQPVIDDPLAGNYQAVTSNRAYTEGIVFRVQILAKSNGRANPLSLVQRYNLNQTVEEEYANNMYRYLTGVFTSYAQAAGYARTLQDKGISDAFVVAYQNGIRVPVKQVIR